MENNPPTSQKKPSLREKWYIIIFEADTPAGKTFDIILLVAILFSVLAVMLDSVPEINKNYGYELHVVEWIFTILFTIEFIARMYVVEKKKSYLFSFFGVVDFVSVLPTYLSLVLIGSHALLILRSLRLLRIFRVMKLVRYLDAAGNLSDALKASKAKILVFLGTVFIIVVIMGTMMYIIEGPVHGFTSIPTSIYWAIVTLTTVGYGDIAPATVLGQSLASIIMIMGYGIIAVPTGIVSAEMVSQRKSSVKPTTRVCHNCLGEGHDSDAKYCKFCGTSF